MKMRPALAVFLIASVAGFAFNAVSTADFVQHLDRQTHALSCSFIPGLGRDASGTTGCHAALMSPYSSVLRSTVWGGIPSTLAGMSVFAFLTWRSVRVALGGTDRDRSEVGFLWLATLLPVLTSLFYASISAFVLQELCKTCAGTYVSSFAAAAAGGWLFFTATKVAKPADAEPTDAEPVELPEVVPVTPFGGVFLKGMAEGTGFVVVPVLMYGLLVPDFSTRLGACGELIKPADPAHLFVALGPQGAGIPSIELLDPLCPACAAFEDRLEFSGLGSRLSRQVVLFPLDNTCNWMIGSAAHPGACTVSEAVLCAGAEAEAVIKWAFEHSEEIRVATKADPEAAGRMVKAAFPAVGSCIGTDKVRQKLNRSLRWAVANQLPIVTPQLYVGTRKLCDEDTDLGLDWALKRLIDSHNEQPKKEAP